jgi:hypothetical protein
MVILKAATSSLENPFNPSFIKINELPQIHESTIKIIHDAVLVFIKDTNVTFRIENIFIN